MQLGRNPKFPATMQKSPMFPISSQDEGRLPCFDWRGIVTFPSHLKRRSVTYCNLRGTPRFLPQVETTPSPPSARDEARFPRSDSRAIPRSASQLERRHDSLYATREVPRDTCRNSRGTPSFPPQLRRAPCYPPHLKIRVNSPAST